MKVRLMFFTWLGMALLHSTPAMSHHSNVAFDQTKLMTLTGIVKEFRWVNPHTQLVLTVDDPKAGKVDWTIEGRAPGIYIRAGWTKKSLVSGDTVTVTLSLSRDGSKSGLLNRITKADGTVLPQSEPPVQ